MNVEKTPAAAPLNDDEVLGVFGRLKESLNEIKSAAHSSRTSVAGSSFAADHIPPDSSRRPSMMSNRASEVPSHRRGTSIDHPASGERNLGVQVNGFGDHPPNSSTNDGKSNRKHSRNPSFSSRTSHAAASDHHNSSRATASRPSNLDVSRTFEVNGTHLDFSVNGSRYSSLKRQESHRSRADSRSSNKSYRSSYRVKPTSAELTDIYLENYHREWMLYWNTQQQLQRAQTPTLSTSGFGQFASPGYGIPQSVSASNLSSVTASQPPKQPIMVPTVKPQAPIVQPPAPVVSDNLERSAGFSSSANGAFQPPSKPPSTLSAVSLPPGNLKPVVALKKPVFKGSLRSSNRTVEVVGSGRTTTVVVKSYDVQPETFETEMALFPGIMLWDSEALRESVVDFARHMSNYVADAQTGSNAETEIVFWDLVAHLLSRGQALPPYEVAEILLRLAPNTGRNSVSSVRSEVVRARDRYPDSSLAAMRRCLLIGDIESAIQYAELADYWDLALFLQTATSNVTTKNRQASELALRSLDLKIRPGDPVHTLCSLACGRLPNVDFCTRDWASNLAVVLSCSTFVTLKDLRARFIHALADALSDADMPLPRDICLLFGQPEQRFSREPFTLIGCDDPCNEGRFSMRHFFMTEVFVYLAQVFQNVNLHASPALIKVELQYLQHLIQNNLLEQAVTCVRNVVLVVRDYGVPLSFEVYAHLFEIAVSCIGPRREEFREDWYQWLWSVFTAYRRSKMGNAPEDPMASPYVQRASFSRSEEFHVERTPSRASSPSISISERMSVHENNHLEYAGNQLSGSRRSSFSKSEMRRNSVTSAAISSTSLADLPPPSSNNVEHPPAIPLFSALGSPSRPSLLAPFAAPLIEQPAETPEVPSLSSPLDANLNTGQGNYYSGIEQVDSSSTAEEDLLVNGSAESKMYDPTQDDTPLPFERAEKTATDNKSPKKSQNPGLSGKLFELRKKIGKAFTFKRTQIHLPDDSKKTIYYDEVRKMWVNTASPQDEQAAPLPPPPTTMTANSAIVSNGSLPGAAAPPLTLNNSFRLQSSAASGVYNPHSAIMANLQAAQQKTKPVTLSNFFVPPPAIPEE